jgi:hypothetical protein
MTGGFRLAFIATVAAAVVIGASSLARPGDSIAPAWTEIAWPFPIDEWGTGKAYRCAASACGREVSAYLRSKIGFCNCTGGVADDSELERLSDFQLLGGKATAMDGGRPVTVGWMTGRSRVYALLGWLSRRLMISVAFSNECDALVATAVTSQGAAADIEPQVIVFLNGDLVQAWSKAQLGL